MVFLVKDQSKTTNGGAKQFFKGDFVWESRCAINRQIIEQRRALNATDLLLI
jgi:hypothetical protein